MWEERENTNNRHRRTSPRGGNSISILGAGKVSGSPITMLMDDLYGEVGSQRFKVEAQRQSPAPQLLPNSLMQDVPSTELDHVKTDMHKVT